ncbi:hypothetical protein BU25DRAFT_490755 [Macroventuria anomochaeta]|uniref:Uncharacterized protein n=1 Tax=Macroventuria anomochaeta TaxID=301207 RepID=A0ACB6S260_9PLEO|nr:uncharacterized protein BU25DRAFT_490755 [Macroventuria anomochaeta]KAF2628114.1 hypothetical protein BU25DRAFT_490755 [Macroventuria anomochaeta]
MAAIPPPPPHSPKTSARPAKSLLASSLLSPSSLTTIFDSLNISKTSVAPSDSPYVLQTGVKSLDDALGPTLQSGRVVALSSETSSQRDDLAKTLLVDCLVRYAEGMVAVVDTTGNFDVVGLYTRILSRLEKESDVDGATGDESEKQEREGLAARVLDRVVIMRVFDFVGAREAVGELRDGLEGRAIKSENHGAQEGRLNAEEVNIPAEMITKENQSPPPKKTEIADSEDEASDISASDDEMLFDTAAPPATAPTPALLPLAQPEQRDPPKAQPQPKLKLILIDNLSHILTPLLKRDAIRSNTLATTFLTTLTNLTRTYALHTILLNPCIPPRTPSPTRQPPSHTIPPPQANAPAPQQNYVPQPPPRPSIFSSNQAMPALLGLLSRYADAHALVTMLPRGKMDARVYCADAGGRERGRRRGVEMVGVCELVADRWGGRVGGWGLCKEGVGSV